jgi:hypothetical protein
VDAKPGFLQQIIRIAAACQLRYKKAMQLRANTFDEGRGRREIALLIAGHQHLQIAVRAHEINSLIPIFVFMSVFVQSVSGSQAAPPDPFPHHRVRLKRPKSYAVGFNLNDS